MKIIWTVSISQMKKMGGLSSIMGMLPGMPGMGNKKMPELDSEENEKKMARMEAMIQSMTVEERRNPDLLNPIKKAPNRKRCRCRYCGSEPHGKTV